VVRVGIDPGTNCVVGESEEDEMRFAHRLGLLGLALAASVALAGAQATTGSIQGVVRDNQDALVPGATVTVRHVQTNASRTLATDGTGAYRFLNMPAS
jgi:hypothetical protein